VSLTVITDEILLSAHVTVLWERLVTASDRKTSYDYTKAADFND